MAGGGGGGAGGGGGMGTLYTKIELQTGSLMSELGRLGKEINRQKLLMEALDKAFARGRVTAQQYATQSAVVQGAMGRASSEAAKLSYQLNRLQSSSTGSGYAILQMAQFADDMQYGFSAVVNQMPQMLMAMGVPTKIAGALSIGAVAINVFSQQWDDLKEMMSDTQAFKDAEDAIKRLKDVISNEIHGATGGWLALPGTKDFKNPKKDALAIRDKAAKEGAEASGGILGRDAQDRAKGVHEALEDYTGGGAGAVEDMFRAKMRQNPKMYAGPKGEKARDNLKKNVERLFGDALKGEKAAIDELMRTFPEQTELGDKLRQFSPEGKRQQASMDGEGHAHEERFKENEKKSKEEWDDLESEWKGMKQAQEKRDEEASRLLGHGAMKRRALAGGLTDRAVEGMLNRTGIKGANAATVRKKLEHDVTSAIAERAAQDGVTPDVARRRLIADEDEHRREARNKAADKAAEGARRNDPTLDGAARAMARDRIAAGEHPEATARAVSSALGQELRRRGLGAEDAAAASGVIGREATSQAGSSLIESMSQKAPELIAASALGDKLLQAGTQDFSKEQLGVLKDILAAVKEPPRENRPGGGVAVLG